MSKPVDLLFEYRTGRRPWPALIRASCRTCDATVTEWTLDLSNGVPPPFEPATAPSLIFHGSAVSVKMPACCAEPKLRLLYEDGWLIEPEPTPHPPT